MYENVFGMKVAENHGIYNVGFENGMALYQRELFESISRLHVGEGKSNDTVIYFEFDNLPSIKERVLEYRLEFIHDIEEMPWGQSVFRVLDFDGHVLEVAEDMDICLRRLLANGLSVGQITEKAGYSEDHVRERLQT
jgi:hypothetical protein